MIESIVTTLLAFTLLVNSERPVDLVPDANLAVRAYIRAETLCATNQWSHEGWMDSFEGLQRAGGNYFGENLARNFKTFEEAHKALMNSPSHRENILNPHYKRIGAAKGSCGTIVQLFSSEGFQWANPS